MSAQRLLEKIKAWRDDDKSGYSTAIGLLCEAEICLIETETLRDRFAMQTLTGILPDDFTPEHLAETAYRIADAMLAERAK